MRLMTLAAGAALTAIPLLSPAAEGEISVERGKQISIIGGCHDCHTANYNETGGQIDPATALKGTAIGWRGPWGTTYPKNLRLTAADKTEDQFVKFAKEFKTLPPMPFYNVHAMDESDVRSLYQYVKSLGEPGEPMPDTVPPDEEPQTPYYPMVPPTMPKT
jgi:mono/diheme cytochrome c family protein